MKQQFFPTHRNPILQQTDRAWPILNRPTLMFLQEYKDKLSFFGGEGGGRRHRILPEGAFVTQLSSCAGISVWRIVWVTTDYDLMSDMSMGKTENPATNMGKASDTMYYSGL